MTAQLIVGVSPTTNDMAAAVLVSAAAASATAPLTMMTPRVAALAPNVERAVEEMKGAVNVLEVAMTVKEAAVVAWDAEEAVAVAGVGVKQEALETAVSLATGVTVVVRAVGEVDGAVNVLAVAMAVKEATVVACDAEEAVAVAGVRVEQEALVTALSLSTEVTAVVRAVVVAMRAAAVPEGRVACASALAPPQLLRPQGPLHRHPRQFRLPRAAVVSVHRSRGCDSNYYAVVE